MAHTDTIVALATPSGRSGIGVLRLSGESSLAIVGRLTAISKDLSVRRAELRKLIDPSSGEPIDDALITYFQAPNSFTGEDVVEISCHGSPVLLRLVLDMCLRHGARLAEAGEFTLRALGNRKIDLAEAEAIRDIIDARTGAAARQAVRQLRGELSQQLQPLKDDLLNAIVVLESALEFVEDDLPQVQLESVRSSLRNIAVETERLAETFQAGHLIREGLKVAIVGRPNVGKSSLFNRLLGSDRAIVTDIAGTTRDQLRESFTIDNIPISLVDTAGLRETSDTVESIGVERSRSAMADADLVVVLLDSSDDLTDEDREILNSVNGTNYVVAANKIDKAPSRGVDDLIAGHDVSLEDIRNRIVPISAKTGEGLDDLKTAIIAPFASRDISGAGFLVTDARHHDLLLRAAGDIRESLVSLDQGLSEEIVLIGMHNAIRYLGEITGETTTEDMLTRIFSTFCIGK